LQWAIASALHTTVLSEGCLNTLYHRPKDAADIKALSFHIPRSRRSTLPVSSPVGSIVASLAGKHLKPVVLELGSKGLASVCEDAHIYEQPRSVASVHFSMAARFA
jgi:acyl-CoA reductase-like NAD-dependent aldehyde dehydrogenase